MRQCGQHSTTHVVRRAAIEIQSLTYRTDLMLLAFDGEIVNRGEYLVVRSPNNPSYYWGNFLFFKAPPSAGDKDRWLQLFEREIGRPPAVKHQTFGWDSPGGETGDIQPFLDDGFRLESLEALAATDVHPPPHLNDQVSIRPLETDSEWAHALENWMRTREPGHEEHAHRAYLQSQLAQRQALVAAGWGAWYGAFLDDELVSDLGIFGRDGLGRYQSVQTHPDFRRRGIAGTLVFRAARHAMQTWGLRKLVIVADQDSAAGRLYRSIGFALADQASGLERWPGMPA